MGKNYEIYWPAMGKKICKIHPSIIVNCKEKKNNLTIGRNKISRNSSIVCGKESYENRHSVLRKKIWKSSFNCWKKKSRNLPVIGKKILKFFSWLQKNNVESLISCRKNTRDFCKSITKKPCNFCKLLKGKNCKICWSVIAKYHKIYQLIIIKIVKILQSVAEGGNREIYQSNVGRGIAKFNRS